jgi:hypothetical protein
MIRGGEALIDPFDLLFHRRKFLQQSRGMTHLGDSDAQVFRLSFQIPTLILESRNRVRRL